MNFKLELFGNACNGNPWLTISHNGHVVHSEYVDGNRVVELDLKLEQSNLITLSGIGKKTGEDGNWDTVIDENNKIVQDKYLVVKDILIDKISMGSDWIKTLQVEPVQHKQPPFTGWWQNGSVSFTLDLPVLDWIIQQKFINAQLPTTSDTNARSGDDRFDYDYIQRKIVAIKKIISD